MTRIGAYTPETARMIHEVVSYLKNSGFVVQRPGRDGQFVPPPAPIYVRNDTGEEIPPFGCVQTDGTAEDGGQNYVKVVKPADVTGAAGWYLFNGIAPIEIGGYGVAHDGPLVRMLTDGSAVTNGAKWAPVVSAFTVAPAAGGIFTAVGADDIEPNVMRGFSSQGGGGGGATLFMFSLNEEWIAVTAAGNVADADILNMDGTDTGIDNDVRDPLEIFASLGTGDFGLCLLQNGDYYAIQAPCPTGGA